MVLLPDQVTLAKGMERKERCAKERSRHRILERKDHIFLEKGKSVRVPLPPFRP